VTRADPERERLRIVIYRCVACGGTWRVLPRFLARHLWRRWRVVEAQTVGAPPPPSWPAVPARTVQRWKERLRSAARQLVRILSTTANALLEEIARSVGLDATRGELVTVHAAVVGSAPGQHLADVAALIHRLVRGVRLM
jgi:hypothetical protein